jgi:hypothetical protein
MGLSASLMSNVGIEKDFIRGRTAGAVYHIALHQRERYQSQMRLCWSVPVEVVENALFHP